MHRVVIDKRYQILKKLGSGTMGEVYKVLDLNENNIKALKILSKHKTSSEAVQRFKREFSLLAGLHHPNLCAVYDFGILKDGCSYFTMEYIEGQDIFKTTEGFSHQKIYPLIVQLCRVLEYIHAKGLIHYDIKPSNVFVQVSGVNNENAVVKLMDFGLAGEQQIRSGVLIKGTLPYIAPEVIRGLVIDHRADLYSLGVLLFEIFTRRKIRVSRRMSFATLVKQKPAYPRRLKADVGLPKSLERIIFKLIAYEPTQRFSRANEVIKEINKISDSRFELETEKTLEGYLLSSRFVGRNKEMDLLKSLYERACQGEGKVILVSGDAGIGKSRLLKEFKVFVQFQCRSCFIGFAHGDKTKPLEPFYDVFKELLKNIDKKFSLKLSLAVLFKIFPDLADGHLRRCLPKLISLEPQAARLRTFEALSEFIRYMAAAMGGFVVLLEDLHWADDLSIQFLEYLGRNIRDRSVLICGTVRREEVDKNLVLAKAINNLRTENCLVPVELRPLAYKSLYAFLDSTITSTSNSAELTKYLMDKTGGNPFFVEEIVRTWLYQGGLRISRKVGIEDFKKVAIPGTVKDVVLSRISDLDSSSQMVMKYGALLRKDFDFDLMKRLTGLDDTTLTAVLWELKRRQIFVEEGNRFRFYHPTLREALHTQLGDRERQSLNYQIGKALEFKNRYRIDKVVEDLAHYFINAHHKKGISYGLRAAKMSRERYANEQAIKFYKNILSLMGIKETKLRFETLDKLAKTEIANGYYDDGIKHFNELLNMKIGIADQKINVSLGIANVYARRGDNYKALDFYKKSIKFLKMMSAGSLKTLLKTYFDARMCCLYRRIGNDEGANKFNFFALASFKNLKSKRAMVLLASIYNDIGNNEYRKEEYSKMDLDKAISYFEEAYRYSKRLMSEERIAAVLINLGGCYFLKFEFQKGFACYKKAIRLAEKIGDQYALSALLLNLGTLFLKNGCYLHALDNFQKVQTISKKVINPFMTGSSLLGIGECFLRLCNYKKAKEYFEKSLKISGLTGNREQKSLLLGDLGAIQQAIGNYTLALRFYRQALKISKDIGNQQSIGLLFIDIGLLLIELGEFSKAKKYICDALKIAAIIDAKRIEIRCYLGLCRLNIMMKDHGAAYSYYKKGVKIAKKTGMKKERLQFFLLFSEIYYHGIKYLKGIKFANKAIKLANEIGTKDLYVQALLMKVKNGVAQGILSKVEILKILEEAAKIAEEIGNPEILWKVYFEYGRFFQNNRGNSKALEYYQRCNRIFRDIGRYINKEAYLKSYLGRADRQEVFKAIDEIIQIK